MRAGGGGGGGDSLKLLGWDDKRIDPRICAEELALEKQMFYYSR